MKHETQTSYDADVDQALSIVTYDKADTASSNVIQFPTDRIDTRPQRQVAELSQADAESVVDEQGASPSERGRNFGVTTAALAGAALVALGFAPRGGGDTPPPQPESFTDQVQESAQIPYNPATDELVVDGIRIKPGNPNRNSASEAVLSDKDVKAYVANHPEESSSITSSTMVLPTNEAGEYVVVKRDVDNDGDTDAVAVSASK